VYADLDVDYDFIYYYSISAVNGIGVEGNMSNIVGTEVRQPPQYQPEVYVPPLPFVALSGSMDCANEKAAVISEPGAAITVTYSSTGGFVAGGTAGSDGKFEFNPPLVGRYTISANKVNTQSSTISLTARDCVAPLQLGLGRNLKCTSGAGGLECKIVIDVTSNKVSDISINLDEFVPRAIRTAVDVFDRTNQKISQYELLDGMFRVPPQFSITSQFSIVMDTLIRATTPIFNATNNSARISINNPTDADLTVERLTIPLPPEAVNRTIRSVTYVPVGGTPVTITQFTIENGSIIITQTLEVKKS